jgi:hypothetical protein
MFRGFTRRLAAAGESTAPAITASPEKVIVKKCSMVSRFRSFFSGAVFASAVGMYIITFQLQGLLDEVKSAVYDVSVRQQLLESKIAKLETPSSAPTE